MRFDRLKRREFITLVGGTTATWPFTAHAQEPDKTRRIGVLIALAQSDPEAKAWVGGFLQGLNKRGWSEERNLHVESRFAPSAGEVQALAKELVSLRPEVIFAMPTPAIAALQRETHEIPIVFAALADPIGSGFIASLPRPGGNITGVMQYEPSVTGKWLSMLKDIAPPLARVAFVINPKTAPFYNYYQRAAEPLSQSLGIELVPTFVETPTEINSAIESFARVPNGGLLVPPDITTFAHRDLIIALAARHSLPAVYSFRLVVLAGGLISYGLDVVDTCRQAAYYVDRILRGDKPAELPVQAATKFETALNLKTAKALGLTVPAYLLVAADDLVE
jgi:putative tryptophan/tyrosine transport system substrate-binding protein